MASGKLKLLLIVGAVRQVGLPQCDVATDSDQQVYPLLSRRIRDGAVVFPCRMSRLPVLDKIRLGNGT
jgi:hypothetical protein